MVRGRKDTNTQAACCQSGITSREESKESGQGKMPMLKRSTCEQLVKLMKKLRGALLMRARWVRGRHRADKRPVPVWPATEATAKDGPTGSPRALLALRKRNSH